MKSGSKKWQRLKLDDVCLKITDGTHKTPNYIENGIPFISTVNIVPYVSDFDYSKYQKFITEEEHKELMKRANPQKGDLLMAKCGTIGRTQMVRVDYEFDIFVGLMLLKLNKNKVNPKFLEYYLNQLNVIKQLELLSTGATRLTLPIKALKEFEISLPFKNNQPDLEEQESIANRIDKLFAETEKGENKTKEVYDSISLLLNSELSKIFNKANSDNGWRVSKISEIGKVKGGKRIPKGVKFSDSETPYKYIRVSDMIYGGINVEKVKSIKKEVYDFLKNYRISYQDVFISIAGTIGRVGTIPKPLDDSILTENAAKISLDSKKFNKDFIGYVLNAPQAQRQIVNSTKKMGQPKLALFRINEINIPIPIKKGAIDLEKQNEIVQRLNKVKNLSLNFQENLQKQLEMFSKLRQSFLAKAFTGKL